MALQKRYAPYSLKQPPKYTLYTKSGIIANMQPIRILKSLLKISKRYEAVNKDSAALALDSFEQKWGNKCRYAVRSWRTNWDDLTTFFDYPMEIRKIIYTTNLIENLNGKIRKYTKAKLSFPIEIVLRNLKSIPTEVVSFYSAALINIASAFPQIKCSYINLFKIDNKYSRLETVYEAFKKHNNLSEFSV